MRLIKRYANRKFYDISNSDYVTLGEIGRILKTEEVKVIDNRRGDDITTKTLVSILNKKYETNPPSDEDLIKKILL